MSKVHTPQEKKRLSYERDHYNRGGESAEAWRKAKPLKKKKASRAFRKTSRDLMRVADEETGPVNARKKLASARKKKVVDWGSIHLKDFVANRQQARAERHGINLPNKKIKARNQSRSLGSNT